jgi:hypothetical protein
MLPDKTKIRSEGNMEVWASGRGTSTDETKPCALPTRSTLETAASEPVNVTATTTTVAGKWYRVGEAREDAIKLNGTPFKETLSGGEIKQTGLEHKIEVEGLETEVSRVANLENMNDQIVDIIIKEKNSAKVYYLRGFGQSVGYENPFSFKKANSIKYEASRYSSKINKVTLVTTGFPTTVAVIYEGDLA